MKHANDLNRVLFLVVVALLVWVILIVRIIQVQIINRGKFVERAKAQYIQEMKLTSNRGIIYDRNHKYLAINKPVYSLGVDISKVTDRQYAATQFSEVLGGNASYYLKHLSNGKNFFWLKRGVEKDIIQTLEQQNINGLSVVPELKRYYPQNKLAAHLIGFTDVDLKGLSGVEFVKEEILSGKSGWAKLQRDAFGKPVADMSSTGKEPESGKNVVLTVDNSLQLCAEEELQQAVDYYNADGGTVIITNPQTGEILAMAVVPTFNPNKAGDYPPHFWRSKAITDNFEPGSTFKPIFLSAVLEEDIKKPDDIVFCENGKYEIYNNTISDIGSYDWLTVSKVISKSSNIGMSKIALDVKKELIYQYIRAFGFGVRTGIELSGEVAGELKNTIEWTKSTPLAMSRGYEISATPLQMAMSFCVIANGGNLLMPRIFANEDELNNGEIIIKPKIIRRAISEKTAQTLTTMLENVVTEGTGKQAAIPGLRIAGKTGTTKKYDVKKQAYSENEFIASFIGFFPIEKPELLIYVMVDNPKKEYLGGIVAASTFKRIAQRARRILDIDSNSFVKDIPSNGNGEKKINEHKIEIPDVVYKKDYVGEKIIEDLGLHVEINNSGQLIKNQIPPAGTKVSTDAAITLELTNIENEDNKKYTKVPKVVGLSIRDALNKFSLRDLHVLVQGSGRVVKQSPAPGEKILRGARCVITCKPLVDLSEFKHW